jgi:hypothetical protein
MISIKITIENGKGQPGEDARPPPTQSEKKGGASSIPTPPHSGGRRQGTYKRNEVARIVPVQRLEPQLVPPIATGNQPCRKREGG